MLVESIRVRGDPWRWFARHASSTWCGQCWSAHGSSSAPATKPKRSCLPLWLLAKPARVTEHRELDDVSSEEEGDRPVGNHAQLSGQERKLVQVVRAGDPPAEEATQTQSRDLGDALVVPERCHLSEHAV